MIKYLEEHRRLVSWILTIFLVLIMGLGFDFYYDLNDDTTIKDIVSGAYTGTPSGYVVQMLYPLGWFISIFYKAVPALPWYGLFLCLCQFACLGLVCNRSLENGVDKLCFPFLMLVAVCFRYLVINQYSLTSAISMVCAIFLFMTSKESGLKENLTSIVLVIISFMLRTEMCLMLFPFLAIAGLCKMLENKDSIKDYLKILLFAFAGMALAYGIDFLSVNVVANGEEWQEYQEFFDARTDLYDYYGIPVYEDNQELYAKVGLTKEEYDLLQNYNFSLDEDIDAKSLSTLADYQRQNSGYKNTPKEGVWLYKELLIGHLPISNSQIWAIALIILYILYIVVNGIKRWEGYVKCLLLFMARSVLWIYLLMVDRAIDRVTVPLVLAECMVLIGWIYEKNKVSHVNGALIAFVSLALLVTNVQATFSEIADRESVNYRWETLMEYCKSHNESYYLIDVYSSTSYNGIAYSEKIFKSVDNSYKNFDICGGWLSKSPLMYEKLEIMGLADIQRDLWDDTKSVYFIAKPESDISWIESYYLSKGIEVSISMEDEITVDDEILFNVYDIEEKS